MCFSPIFHHSTLWQKSKSFRSEKIFQQLICFHHFKLCDYILSHIIDSCNFWNWNIRSIYLHHLLASYVFTLIKLRILLNGNSDCYLKCFSRAISSIRFTLWLKCSSLLVVDRSFYHVQENQISNNSSFYLDIQTFE